MAILFGLLSCVFVRLAYFGVHYILNTRAGRYAALEPHRQMYVQKNLVKSCYLCALVLAGSWVAIRPIVYENRWDNGVIRLLAVMYGSNDLVGVLVVDQLPTTTKMHHIVSSILVCAAMLIDFQTSLVGQSMLVYTFTSASAYLVNLHLGLRLILESYQLARLRRCAATLYVVACLISWSVHVWWWSQHGAFHWYECLYFIFLSIIIRDDIILMNWLVKDKKMAKDQ